MKERISYMIVGIYGMGLLSLFVSQSKKQIQYNPIKNKWL
jgi:hypothetical protein